MGVGDVPAAAEADGDLRHHKCSGEEPFPTITIEMDKKATLAELKAAVLSKFPSGMIIFLLLLLF